MITSTFLDVVGSCSTLGVVFLDDAVVMGLYCCIDVVSVVVEVHGGMLVVVLDWVRIDGWVVCAHSPVDD